MLHNLIKKFQNILLKPLLKEEIEILRILRNKEGNRKCFIYQREISKEEQEKWYQKYLEKEDDVMFAAYLDNIETPVGYVALYDIDKDNKSCEFGRILVDKDKVKEKGIGYLITRCCCNIAVEELGMERIYLEVFSDNIPAIKTYLKAGFEEKKKYVKDDREIIYMEYLK